MKFTLIWGIILTLGGILLVTARFQLGWIVGTGLVAVSAIMFWMTLSQFVPTPIEFELREDCLLARFSNGHAKRWVWHDPDLDLTVVSASRESSHAETTMEWNYIARRPVGAIPISRQLNDAIIDMAHKLDLSVETVQKSGFAQGVYSKVMATRLLSRREK